MVNIWLLILWLVVDQPLWKIWVRQLGLLFPIYGKIWENKSHVPSSKPPTRKDEKIGTHQQTSPNTDGHLVNQISTDHAKRPKRELSGSLSSWAKVQLKQLGWSAWIPMEQREFQVGPLPRGKSLKNWKLSWLWNSELLFHFRMAVEFLMPPSLEPQHPLLQHHFPSWD